jgi:protein-S-isoprenylcysteine O-methyltransferase Ste14
MKLREALRTAWRLLLSLDDKIFGLILVPIAANSWLHLAEGVSRYWPSVAAGSYGLSAIALLPTAFSAAYVSGASILLLTAGQPLARDESIAANALAAAGAFGVYAFTLLPRENEPAAGFFVPLALMALGGALVLLSLLYLRRSFSVTAQARRIRRSGPYAVIRHPMYAGNILSLLGLGLLIGTPLSLVLSFVIAALQIGRAYFEERLLGAAFPDYAAYKAKAGAFLPRPGGRHTKSVE